MAEQRGDTTAGQLQVDVEAEIGVIQAKARADGIVIAELTHPRHPCLKRLP